MASALAAARARCLGPDAGSAGACRFGGKGAVSFLVGSGSPLEARSLDLNELSNVERTGADLKPRLGEERKRQRTL